jgi:hypothetical protein
MPMEKGALPRRMHCIGHKQWHGSQQTCPLQVRWEEDFGLTGKYSRGESVRPWDVQLVATWQHHNSWAHVRSLRHGVGAAARALFQWNIRKSREVHVLMFYMSMFFYITPTHTPSHPYSYTIQTHQCIIQAHTQMLDCASMLLVLGFLVDFKRLFGSFTYDVTGVLLVVEYVKPKVWLFLSGGRRDGIQSKVLDGIFENQWVCVVMLYVPHVLLHRIHSRHDRLHSYEQPDKPMHRTYPMQGPGGMLLFGFLVDF